MAQNPNITQLDPGQIAKRVYDEANDRLRVDANITAPDGSSILIDATTDSIKIGNTATGPFLNINPDGSINSNVTGTIVATNPSVGTTGDTAPTSATEIGGIDSSGNLVGLKVNNSGQLLVSSDSGTNTPINVYNEITNLAMGTETTIVSYTVPSGANYYLQFIEAAGQNLAEYHIYQNSSIIAKKYSSYTEYNVNFDYKTGISSTPGIFLTTGDVVYVKVLNVSNSTANFNSRIQILEIS